MASWSRFLALLRFAGLFAVAGAIVPVVLVLLRFIGDDQRIGPSRLISWLPRGMLAYAVLGAILGVLLGLSLMLLARVSRKPPVIVMLVRAGAATGLVMGALALIIDGVSLTWGTLPELAAFCGASVLFGSTIGLMTGIVSQRAALPLGQRSRLPPG